MKPATPPTKNEKKEKIDRFLFWFPKIFIFCLILFNFLEPHGFMAMDNRWVDTMFRMRGMEDGDKKITIVTIDDKSIKEIGQYPWPRRVYKRLIGRLVKNYGAKVVALDVMFPDRSNPVDDRALIQAVKDAGEHVIVGVGRDNTIVNRLVPVYPFPALKKVSKGFGSVYQPLIGEDGSVRSTTLAVDEQLNIIDWKLADDLLPSLGGETLRLFTGKPLREFIEKYGFDIRLNFRGVREQTVGTQVVDGVSEPINVRVHGFPRVMAMDVLSGNLNELQEARIKDGIVFVGSTALGAFDHYPNAFDEQMPGVLVHANLVDNVLNDRVLRGPSLLLTVFLIILFGMIARQLVRLDPLWGGLGFLATIGVWACVAYIAFLQLYLVEFSAPLTSLICVFGALMLHKTMIEMKQKSQVRAMFGQYVAPEVVSILVKDPDKLKLGGEKRDMTMFFLDIAHFTTISEKMKPEALIQFLNTYLTALTDDVLNNNGVVDKYIGDCIMAFWNAPLDEPAHRRKSCLAAVDCLKTIERLNREYVDPTIPERPAVRIGLNSGEVVVGNTGSARKLAYTVLGDEVNLASRLEGANKFFGSTVMVSEGTFKGAKEAVEGRFLGRVRVVGKDIPIGVYELLGRKGELPQEWKEALPLYQEALDIFHKRDFEKAKAAFEKVQKAVPGDKPSKLYLNVCDDYIAITPSDREDWAVFNLTSK